LIPTDEPREQRLELIAIRLSSGMEIRPAPIARAWMETPAGKFAKRCLPLLIANQAGWELLNPSGFTATWSGADDLAAIKIWPDGGTPKTWVTSHFGSGILTWHIPYLFRTSRGHNILVRGPANMPKDGVAALEGIVETDWTMGTFTMNWKFTRANQIVRFEPGEPFAMLVPIRRGELETFHTTIREVWSEPSTFAAFQQFATSRQEFLRGVNIPGSAAQRAGWQRHYMVGNNIDGTAAPEHQTKLQLASFELER
jgi:hypothetical protein